MKLRILHVLASPHLGGAEQVCLHLAEALLATGHQLALHVSVSGKVTEAAEAAGIPIIGVQLEIQERPLSRRERWEVMARQLVAATREFKPDLVHSHVPISHLICHRVMNELSVPWVATIHGSWKQFAYAPQTQNRPYLRPYLLLRHALGDFFTTRSAARIVAVSDSVKYDLKRVGIVSRRIVRIHNGLPENPSPLSTEMGRARLGLPEDAFIVGSLGFFAPVKGFDLLIRAVALLIPRHPKLMLLIAGGDVLGEGSIRASLYRLIERLGMQERVRLLDRLNPKEGFLSALDVYVVSSRTEGLPLSLIEAMQHAKPSVVTSAGGCTEAVRPEREGLVFKTGNIRSLAQTIERFIAEEKLRLLLGPMAQKRTTEYLTLRRCVDEYEQLYHDVLIPRVVPIKCLSNHE